MNALEFIEGKEEITVDHDPGTTINVTQHDGSVLRLKKLAEDHDPTDRASVMNFIQRHNARGEIVTGLLYVEPDSEDLHDRLGVTARPLNALSDADLCPGSDALDKINAGLR